MEYYSELKYVEKLIVNVGVFLKKQKIKRAVSLKGRDIKLELDRQAELKITESLLREFEYPILGEEFGFSESFENDKLYWIVDPIDGTMNYYRNIQLCCISIALWNGKEPILGVIYDFYNDKLYSGLDGYGARLNGEELIYNKIANKNQGILATGFPVSLEFSKVKTHDLFAFYKDYKKIRMFGSAAISLAFLVEGKVDAYFEENIKIWDVAAGIAIANSINIPFKIEFFNHNNTITKAGLY